MTAPAQSDTYRHDPEPTPDQSDTTGLIAAVAAILLSGAVVALLAAAILALLRRRGIRHLSLESLTLALTLSSARTKAQPRTIGRSDVARAQARTEAFYRAAYVLAAAERLQAAADAARAATTAAAPDPSLDAGTRAAAEADLEAAEADAMRKAAARERSYEAAHERARHARMDAAVAVANAANRYGALLGWHAHRDDRTTPECRAADGCNFRADMPPIIGWPGTLHGGTCRCRPGPPHPDAPTVDEATGMAWRARRPA